MLGKLGLEWPQMGQIWDFLRSVSVHFGSASQNVLKPILKSLIFVPFGAILTQFVANADIPASSHLFEVVSSLI